jgi:hypothetical protein
MARGKLKKEFRDLEVQIMETFKAGCGGDFPKSSSDLGYGIAAVLSMFEIKRLPLPREVYANEKELDDEDIAREIARGAKMIETPSYKITVERQ